MGQVKYSMLNLFLYREKETEEEGEEEEEEGEEEGERDIFNFIH